MAHRVRQYRILMFTNTESLSKTKHNLTSEMGQKISSKLLLRSPPNTDGFYTFYISLGSVATQLRCGGMFSNHFTTNFSQNAPVNFENRSIFDKDMDKTLWLTFWRPPCRPRKNRQMEKETATNRTNSGFTYLSRHSASELQFPTAAHDL